LTSSNTTAVVTMTATCADGLCGVNPCKGVVFSLTDAHLSRCTHICHLPDTWAEQVVLTPPCDEDVVLAEDEIEDLLDREGDRRLEDEWIGAWS
jgi:hypothetical protein